MGAALIRINRTGPPLRQPCLSGGNRCSLAQVPFLAAQRSRPVSLAMEKTSRLPLTGRPPPATSRSFVLLCDDPDAPAGKWHHWAAYDIAPDQTGVVEGAGPDRGAVRFKQAINDFHRAGYGGPCPPRGHGRHRYHFRLLALSVDHLSLGAKPSCSEVEREARRHVVAEATLIGIYQR
jgi:Raf kinase inhibitor-like YbhB/YbcL family protein